jgi:site-specific DNA-cytosine methylase
LWYSKRRRAQHDQDFETWIEGGVCPTLNAFDNTGDSRATVLIIDGTRVDDVRVYEGPVQTLKERMGTGGNNVPIIAFDGYNQPVTENIYRALRIGIDSGDCIAIPIQDGREMEKKQNGLGIGSEGDPSYTLDQTGAQSVAYSIREDATVNTFSATEIQTARALSALRPSVQLYHAQTFITSEEETDMQVRRLTPTECERLMGWPDNHTLPRADGKENPDTTRYKMCGNGVASPVAQWIGQHLMEIMSGP